MFKIITNNPKTSIAVFCLLGFAIFFIILATSSDEDKVEPSSDKDKQISEEPSSEENSQTPVNCVVETTDWIPFGENCPVECGGFKQEKRKYIVTQPLNGGESCPSEDELKALTETRYCNDISCQGGFPNQGQQQQQQQQQGQQGPQGASDIERTVELVNTEAIMPSEGEPFVRNVGGLCQLDNHCESPLQCLPSERNVCFLTDKNETECPQGFVTIDEGGFRENNPDGNWEYSKICCNLESKIKKDDLTKVRAICPANSTGNKYWTSWSHELSKNSNRFVNNQLGYDFNNVDFNHDKSQLKFTACYPYNPDFKKLKEKYCILSPNNKCPDHYSRVSGLPMKSKDKTLFKNRSYPDLGRHDGTQAEKDRGESFRKTYPTLCCVNNFADPKRFKDSLPEYTNLTGNYICRMPYRNQDGECLITNQCRSTNTCVLPSNTFQTTGDELEPEPELTTT